MFKTFIVFKTVCFSGEWVIFFPISRPKILFHGQIFFLLVKSEMSQNNSRYYLQCPYALFSWLQIMKS